MTRIWNLCKDTGRLLASLAIAMGLMAGVVEQRWERDDEQ